MCVCAHVLAERVVYYTLSMTLDSWLVNSPQSSQQIWPDITLFFLPRSFYCSIIFSSSASQRMSSPVYNCICCTQSVTFKLCLCAWAHTCLPASVHVCAHTCVCVCVCVCARAHARLCTHAYVPLSEWESKRETESVHQLVESVCIVRASEWQSVAT